MNEEAMNEKDKKPAAREARHDRHADHHPGVHEDAAQDEPKGTPNADRYHTEISTVKNKPPAR